MLERSTMRAEDLGDCAPVSTKRKAGTGLEVVHLSTSAPSLRIAPVERETTGPILGLDKSENPAASKLVIQQQLARMLQSPIFVHSLRLSRFLRFIVEHAIDGNRDYLKEYVIGSEVYDRRPPYDPSLDSIVRSEARRMRGKLKEYYETEGKDDSLYIYLRPGSYVPVFHYNATSAGTQHLTELSSPISSVKASKITIGLLPFHDISSTSLSSGYARGIPDEIAYALMQTEEYRVMTPGSIAHSNPREHDVATMMNKAGAQIAIEGSVKAQGNQIRITTRIVDAAGVQLWTMRFDTQADPQIIFTTEEEIAAALSAGVGAVIGGSKRLNFP